MAIEVMKHGKVEAITVPCFLARFTDGHGEEHIKVGFVLGDDVRFLDDKVLGKPSQQWLKDDVMIALGLKDEKKKKEDKPAEAGEQQI